MWLLLWSMAWKFQFKWLLKVVYSQIDNVYGFCHISKVLNQSYKILCWCKIYKISKCAASKLMLIRLHQKLLRIPWPINCYRDQNVYVPTFKKKRRNYHHEIGMFSKLPKFLVKLQMYCTRAIITCDWYIFYPIFHCGLYCKEVSVTDIYLLNKEILQFLGLKSTVYNWEQFQIKSRL